jgi:hypothetical protein
MGYQIETVSVEVPVRLSRHNSERDERHNALADELRTLFGAMTRSILSGGKYDEILVNGSAQLPSGTLAITEDVTLKLECSAGVLLLLPLSMAAIISTVNDGDMFSFVYDRNIPDEGEERAPDVRKARLMIVDDGPLIT